MIGPETLEFLLPKPLSLGEILGVEGVADSASVGTDAYIAVEEIVTRLGVQNRAFASFRHG